MKRTIYDEIPIGQAKAGSARRGSAQRHAPHDWTDDEISDAEALRRAGLSPTAIKQFRKRHPKQADWSRTRMIEQMLANKKRRDDASRRKQEAQRPGEE
ncbi:hypothetical protein [Halomonas getboli]|uniref:hypothetical protein n=1 Tax=Halomonas getboli TaxID=2935862 RepID=UPI001FFE773D|nr:hypothetical protein [Halomonas getboli]MCK2183550.1 hypothetical protein [Halomonas getboli]